MMITSKLSTPWHSETTTAVFFFFWFQKLAKNFKTQPSIEKYEQDPKNNLSQGVSLYTGWSKSFNKIDIF